MANFRDDLLTKTLAETKKLTKQVNQRLLRLEREVKGDTFEIVKMRSYLDTDYLESWSKRGRVRYSKIKEEPLKLDALNKQLRKFINNQNTTVRGIRKHLKNVQRETGKPELDYQDLLDYERTYEDLLDWISRYMELSEFWQYTNKAHAIGMPEDSYFEGIIQLADSSIKNDEDAKERIHRLYIKYVVMGD